MKLKWYEANATATAIKCFRLIRFHSQIYNNMIKLCIKKLKHIHHINQNLNVRWDLELNENVEW